MEFTINKAFANNYNAYRQKEELQRLKNRHGDVKLQRKQSSDMSDQTEESNVPNEIGAGIKELDGQEDPGTELLDDRSASATSGESSDDDSSDSDSSQFDQDNADFLKLYGALCRNDPLLKDSSKQWFRDSVDVDVEQSPTDSTKPVTLRAFERDFLLQEGGLEDEERAVEARKVALTDSEQLLSSMSSNMETSRKDFITESKKALKLATAGKNATASNDQHESVDFLHVRRVANPSGGKKLAVNDIDMSGVTFTETGDPESERFLRDYFLEQKWRRKDGDACRMPCYSEVIQNAGLTTMGTKMEDDEIEGAFKEDDILDQDDDFLRRVHVVESEASNSIRPFRHRFEEPDKEVIKSYPRHIDSSIAQQLGKQQSSRAQKRQARAEAKKLAKQAKLAELDRLRDLKREQLSEKINRIKRACGELGTGPKKSTVDENLTALLDEDWDPEQHDKLLSQMFDDDYYQVQEEDGLDTAPPRFSDDEDIGGIEYSTDDDSDHNRGRRGARNGTETSQKDQNDLSSSLHSAATSLPLHSKHSTSSVAQKFLQSLNKEKEVYDPEKYRDFEEYFTKYYDLPCEDIISGITPDDDVYCHFKYREVPANDYGLSAEDVLTCSSRELNSWIPITRVTGYRTQAEEEQDQRMYNSARKLKRKQKILPSLADPDSHWWPQESSRTTNEKPTRKKKRKKKKKKGGPVEETGNPETEQNTLQIHDKESLVRKKKKKRKVTAVAEAEKQRKVKDDVGKREQSENECAQNENTESTKNKDRKCKELYMSRARLEALGVSRSQWYSAQAKRRRKDQNSHTQAE